LHGGGKPGVLRTGPPPYLCIAYAYHLTQVHAFLDGNKRLAAAVAEIFLELNGAELRTTDEEIVTVFLAIATGQVSRQDVEQWFAQRVVFKQEPSA
jgi:death-on-curing protein